MNLIVINFGGHDSTLKEKYIQCMDLFISKYKNSFADCIEALEENDMEEFAINTLFLNKVINNIKDYVTIDQKTVTELKITMMDKIKEYRNRIFKTLENIRENTDIEYYSESINEVHYDLTWICEAS